MRPGTNGCVKIKASAITVGGFVIDDPQVQRKFRKQLIYHEVTKVGDLIEKFVALPADPKVPASDKIMFSALGEWLKADLAKALTAVADASGHDLED